MLRSSQELCFRILKKNNELDFESFTFLIRGGAVFGVDNPLVEWLEDSAWASIQALRAIEPFDSLPEDMVGGAKRFRERYVCTHARERSHTRARSRTYPHAHTCIPSAEASHIRSTPTRPLHEGVSTHAGTSSSGRRSRGCPAT